MCLSDITFFIDEMILFETFFSVSWKDFNFWQNINSCWYLTVFQYHPMKPLLYQLLKCALGQLPYHMFHKVCKILKFHRYVRFCKEYHNLNNLSATWSWLRLLDYVYISLTNPAFGRHSMFMLVTFVGTVCTTFSISLTPTPTMARSW